MDQEDEEEKSKSTTWYVEGGVGVGGDVGKGWIYGDATRELYAVWASALGDSAPLAPESRLQQLFNAIGLFPTKSQVFEMVHCSRESSLFNDDSGGSSGVEASSPPPASDDRAAAAAAEAGIANYLTFGEFCVFATELKRMYAVQDAASSPQSSATSKPKESAEASSSSSSDVADVVAASAKNPSSYDVFLGGSCNPTSWRQDRAIPLLKSRGVTFYNPQQPNWVPEMMELEHQAKRTSKVLLFVLLNSTRNVASMIEVAYLSGRASTSATKRLLVVLEPYPRPDESTSTSHRICGEVVSSSELRELSDGLTTVHDVVERQGMPVFGNLELALGCAARLAAEPGPASTDRLTARDGAQPVRHPRLHVGDRLLCLREAFATMDAQRCGRLGLDDLKMAFRIHAHRDLAAKDARAIMVNVDGKTGLDFNSFCCVVAEFGGSDARKGVEPAEASEPPDGKAFRHRRFLRRVYSAIFHPSGGGEEAAATSARKAKAASAKASEKQRRGSSIRDVYLGGSSSSSASCCWRERDAVPVLKKNGLTFFRPSRSNRRRRRRRTMPIEAAAMDNSRVLLFVVDGGSRSLCSLCEAAYHIGVRRGGSVVLCLQKIPDGGRIDDGEETLTGQATKDYNRGRSYLSDIANREGVPVFESVAEAVECVVQKCK